MISSLIWWVLVVIDICLIIYTFWDHDNRIYGNIITAGISSILAAVLSLFIVAGQVIDETSVIVSKSMNTTLNTTTIYTYAKTQVVMQDTTMSYVMAFIAIFMMIVVVLLIIDARSEVTQESMGDE